jgi:hypothetical protein
MTRVLDYRRRFVLLFLSEELLARYSRSGSLDSIPAYDGALPLFHARRDECFLSSAPFPFFLNYGLHKV